MRHHEPRRRRSSRSRLREIRRVSSAIIPSPAPPVHRPSDRRPVIKQRNKGISAALFGAPPPINNNSAEELFLNRRLITPTELSAHPR